MQLGSRRLRVGALCRIACDKRQNALSAASRLDESKRIDNQGVVGSSQPVPFRRVHHGRPGAGSCSDYLRCLFQNACARAGMSLAEVVIAPFMACFIHFFDFSMSFLTPLPRK